MKAIVYNKYGSADVLHVAEMDKPIAGAGEILIKIHSVEVTKSDCELRSFNFPVKWFWLPLRIALGIRRPKRPVLGGYFSGVVESVGADLNVNRSANVSQFKSADEVFGTAGFAMGAYAEYLVIAATTTLAIKPTNMSFEEACTVPLGGLNALHFMRRANIKPGDSVLINGAGGSIGMYALQIAKDMGAVVTAVDRTIKMDLLKNIGADVVIDYSKESFHNNGETYDVIFDMVAQSSYSKCIKSVKVHGKYIMGNPRFRDMLRSVITPHISKRDVQFAFAGEKTEELVALKSMIEQGRLTTVIDSIHRPENIAQAHRKVETEQRIGCVVLAIN